MSSSMHSESQYSPWGPFFIRERTQAARCVGGRADLYAISKRKLLAPLGDRSPYV